MGLCYCRYLTAAAAGVVRGGGDLITFKGGAPKWPPIAQGSLKINPSCCDFTSESKTRLILVLNASVMIIR